MVARMTVNRNIWQKKNGDMATRAICGCDVLALRFQLPRPAHLERVLDY